MNSMRTRMTATNLRSGNVLVAGGSNRGGPLDTAELYDPATGVWTLTGTVTSARSAHSATLLPDGKVLVAGGSNWPDVRNTAEFYDPATGAWTPAGSLISKRSDHSSGLVQGPRAGSQRTSRSPGRGNLTYLADRCVWVQKVVMRQRLTGFDVCARAAYVSR